MSKIAKKRIVFLGKFIVSGGLLWWVIAQVNWGESWQILRGIHLGTLVFYSAILVLGIILSSYKWMIIAQYKSFKETFWRYFQLYLSGTFINNFLPSFVGGDTYRAYKLNNGRDMLANAFSTVFFDRLSGLWGAILLAVFFSLFHIDSIMQNPVWLGVVCCVLIAFLLDFLFLFQTIRDLFRKLLGLFPKMLSQALIRLFDEVGGFNDRKILLKATALSFTFAYIGVGFANYILFRALGLEMSIIDFFGVIFLISIISALPISIGNIGLKEWAYLTFFGFYGVSPELAVTAAIAGRIIQMVISFFAIPAYLRETALSRADIEKIK